ncbi:MAG: Lrp/AsnC family transcriptional regulator [Halobacteriaceae archaeon]
MDDIDKEILQILQENGRAPYTEIADAVGVSEGTVRNRIKQLQEDGVIKNFTVTLSRSGAEAVVMVQLKTGIDIDSILTQFPSRITILEITGQYDLLVRVERDSTQEVNSLLDNIRRIDGVDNTETYMVLNRRTR